MFAGGHTAPNTPDLFRTPKLTVAGPGQYWTGGPSGNTLGCCQLFFVAIPEFSTFIIKRMKTRVRDHRRPAVPQLTVRTNLGLPSNRLVSDLINILEPVDHRSYMRSAGMGVWSLYPGILAEGAIA